MTSQIKISICEPFMSPAWGSNLIVFSSEDGETIKEEDAKKYLARASRYASNYSVYLVPERFIVLGTESLCLIGPDGGVITAQQEIFTSVQTEINNSNLNIAKADFGRVMLCVGDDIFHPELVRIGANRGAELIISSLNIDSTESTNHKVISGVWNASQQNNLFTIGVSNTANCVCAPRQITKNNEGFVLAPSRKSMVISLELQKLKDLPVRIFLPRSFYSNHRHEIIGPDNYE